MDFFFFPSYVWKNIPVQMRDINSHKFWNNHAGPNNIYINDTSCRHQNSSLCTGKTDRRMPFILVDRWRGRVVAQRERTAQGDGSPGKDQKKNSIYIGTRIVMVSCACSQHKSNRGHLRRVGNTSGCHVDTDTLMRGASFFFCGHKISKRYISLNRVLTYD